MSSLSPQAVYGMDDISSNLGEIVRFTESIGYNLLQKWLNKLAGKTKTFLHSAIRIKTSQSEQLNTLLAVAIARFHSLQVVADMLSIIMIIQISVFFKSMAVLTTLWSSHDQKKFFLDKNTIVFFYNNVRALVSFIST